MTGIPNPFGRLFIHIPHNLLLFVLPQESIELKHLITYLHRFGFRWTVFGFYWLKALDPSIMDLFFKKESQERLLELYVACTVGMLRIVYGHNAMLLR